MGPFQKMLENDGGMTRLVQENSVLRAWVRDLLVTWAELQGDKVFDAFRSQVLDNLARHQFDTASSGIPQAEAEADETALTNFIFKTEGDLIESVVDEARKKWAATRTA